MEATRFDLNTAIARWREELAGSPALRVEDLDELEAHLRESIASLRASALSGEEAFLIASRRMGSCDVMAAEFGKSNKHLVWTDRIFWTLIIVQVWSLVSAVFGAIARSSLAFGLKTAEADFMLNTTQKIVFDGEFLLPVSFFGLASLAATGVSLAFCWWLVVKRGQEIGTRLKPWLTSQRKLTFLCVGFCLVSLLGNGIRIGLGFLAGSIPARQATLYESFSQGMFYPLQVVFLIGFTLFLARKRLAGARSVAAAD